MKIQYGQYQETFFRKKMTPRTLWYPRFKKRIYYNTKVIICQFLPLTLSTQLYLKFFPWHWTKTFPGLTPPGLDPIQKKEHKNVRWTLVSFFNDIASFDKCGQKSLDFGTSTHRLLSYFFFFFLIFLIFSYFFYFCSTKPSYFFLCFSYFFLFFLIFSYFFFFSFFLIFLTFLIFSYFVRPSHLIFSYFSYFLLFFLIFSLKMQNKKK